MNLTTRCPACKTAFKVVPDQLKISSGWVRCGRCSEVFDASTNLVPERAAQTIDAGKITEPQKVFPKATATPIQSIPKADIQRNPISIDKTPNKYSEPQISKSTDEANSSKRNENSIAPDVSALAFVRDANRKAFWQQATTLRLTIFSLFVFAFLLALQVIYDQRDHLAAKSIGMHRTMTTACEFLNCSIQPDLQIDALKIDASSFQKVQSTIDGEISELKVSIKNNATSPIAVPALELSLTDANDRAVLKRVLSVKELKFKEPTIPAQNVSQITMRLLINPSNSTPFEKSQITGYRVLAFYP